MEDKVVVVTRNGRGDVYLANSRLEADRHPLVQYGDVVCEEHGDIILLWNPDEIIRLARAILDEGLLGRVEQIAELQTWDERRRALQAMTEDIWEGLISLAQPLPEDPEVICEVVRRDRKLMETNMSEEAKKVKEKKPKAAPKPKTHGGFRPDQKITLLKDKEGKQYGAEHNPKRPGSAAARIFLKYKSGMTVAEFIAAGGTGAALKYDTVHNYIKVA